MGRKVSESSIRISKKEKKQFNNLVKVLRPKVYITDVSDFKRLVQELTGNGSTLIHSPDQHTIENSPATEIGGRRPNVEIISSSDSDTSVDMYINQVHFNEEVNQSVDIDKSHTVVNCELPLEASSTNYQEDDQGSFTFGDLDLESWCLGDGVEPCSFPDGFAHIEEELSIFDYELLSGLL